MAADDDDDADDAVGARGVRTGKVGADILGNVDDAMMNVVAGDVERRRVLGVVVIRTAVPGMDTPPPPPPPPPLEREI